MLTETHLTKIYDNTFTFLKSSQWFKNLVIGALPLTMITFMPRQVRFDLISLIHVFTMSPFPLCL